MYHKFYEGEIGRMFLFSSYIQAQEVLEIVRADIFQRENCNVSFWKNYRFQFGPKC